MNNEVNIQDKKLELIQWLSTIEDKDLIDKLMDLRNMEHQDWWHTLAEEEKQAIEQGLKEAKAGKLNPHSSARKLYEKWL